MNDSFEILARLSIQISQDLCDIEIRSIKRTRRFRFWHNVIIVPYFLFLAGVNFYHFRYGWGVLDVALLMGCVIYNWKSCEKSIVKAREGKRLFAAHKKRSELLLAEYLEHRERGFE